MPPVDDEAGSVYLLNGGGWLLKYDRQPQPGSASRAEDAGTAPAGS